ncbi:MAG: CRISPR system precrRNA processing endoribonuclease RAMP protein Cas6 [Bryobacteraceae bacterium]
MNTFEFCRLRWHFQALGRLRFPAGESGNVVRGAFGLLLRQTASSDVYARLFEPGRAGGGPSGLRDWPRPFVFRTAAVDGREIASGDPFYIDMHVFDTRPELMAAIRVTFEQLGEAGLGPGRGRAALSRVQRMGADESAWEMRTEPGPPVVISLDPDPAEQAVRQVRLQFLTPTELKGGNGAEFGVLFARLRDRISTLRALYGAGPLAIDFRGLGERARAVELVSSDLDWIGARRRSSRTGQSHPLGGFTGVAEYAGELGEFLPWLRAARWTGVGRQTVWGKGDVRVIA